MMKLGVVKRPFTGRHMAAILVAFFAVVVGVNMLMARFAISTFGGTVVDNSYVASQKFNGWLAEARAQKALGWRMAAERGAQGRLVVTLVGRDGGPVDARVTGEARHPLGLAAPLALRFDRMADGRWISTAALPQGRWALTLEAAQGETRFRAAGDVR